LKWREDSTNQDTYYLRNKLRLNILSRLSVDNRYELVSSLQTASKNNRQIDLQVAKLSQLLFKNDKIDRQLFASLPSDVADELLVFWLRNKKVSDFDSKSVSRLSLAIKTAGSGTIHPVKKSLIIRLSENIAEFEITPNNREGVLV
jgi:hypothetical protein